MFKKGDVLVCVRGDGGQLTLGVNYTAQADQRHPGWVTIVDNGGSMAAWYADRFKLAPKEGAIIEAPVILTWENAEVGMKVVVVRAKPGGPQNGEVVTIKKINGITVNLVGYEGLYFFNRFTLIPEKKEVQAGDKMVCIEGHRGSGLRKGKVVTIKKVGKDVYYLEEFVGGFAKRRFGPYAIVVSAPAVKKAPSPVIPLPVETPYKKGDMVYFVRAGSAKDYPEPPASYSDFLLDGIARQVIYAGPQYIGVTVETGETFYLNSKCLSRTAPCASQIRVPPPLGDIREELKEAKIRRGNPGHTIVSFATRFVKGKSNQLLINPACYAPLNHNYQPIEEFALSTVGHNTIHPEGSASRATCEKYFHYLFNDSPWAPCFITKSVEEAFDKGILMDCNKPIGQLVGAAITVREATEYSGRLAVFQEALDMGFNGNVAYLFGVFFDKRAGGYTLGGANGGHSAFSGQLSFPAVVSFFKNGFPDQGVPPANVKKDGYQVFGSIGNIVDYKHIAQYMQVNTKSEQVGKGFGAYSSITKESLKDIGDKLTQLFKKD